MGGPITQRDATNDITFRKRLRPRGGGREEGRTVITVFVPLRWFLPPVKITFRGNLLEVDTSPAWLGARRSHENCQFAPPVAAKQRTALCGNKRVGDSRRSRKKGKMLLELFAETGVFSGRNYQP